MVQHASSALRWKLKARKVWPWIRRSIKIICGLRRRWLGLSRLLDRSTRLRFWRHSKGKGKRNEDYDLLLGFGVIWCDGLWILKAVAYRASTFRVEMTAFYYNSPKRSSFARSVLPALSNQRFIVIGGSNSLVAFPSFRTNREQWSLAVRLCGPSSCLMSLNLAVSGMCPWTVPPSSSFISHVEIFADTSASNHPSLCGYWRSKSRASLRTADTLHRCKRLKIEKPRVMSKLQIASLWVIFESSISSRASLISSCIVSQEIIAV